MMTINDKGKGAGVKKHQKNDTSQMTAPLSFDQVVTRSLPVPTKICRNEREGRLLNYLILGSYPRVDPIPHSFNSFSSPPPPSPPSSNVMHVPNLSTNLMRLFFKIGIGKNRHCRTVEIFSKLPKVVHRKKYDLGHKVHQYQGPFKNYVSALGVGGLTSADER